MVQDLRLHSTMDVDTSTFDVPTRLVRIESFCQTLGLVQETLSNKFRAIETQINRARDTVDKKLPKEDHLDVSIFSSNEIRQAMIELKDEIYGGMEKTQQLQSLSISKFCLKSCLKSRATVQELVKSLEKKENELYTGLDAGKMMPFVEDCFSVRSSMTSHDGQSLVAEL